MDGSLGLQGTKPNFLGLADLGVGVGAGKLSGQKQDVGATTTSFHKTSAFSPQVKQTFRKALQCLKLRLK